MGRACNIQQSTRPREKKGTRAIVIDPNRELLDRATSEVYKETAEGELKIHLFEPETASPDSGRAVMLCFFGSFWDQGAISQFAPHCTYFASRGMLTGLVEYRVKSKHGTTPLEAISDARSAFRWIRLHTQELRIDPKKVGGAGASGGAYSVFSSAILKGDVIDEKDEDSSIPGAPDFQIGFSPILDISSKGAGLDRFPDAKSAKALSPLHHVGRGLPPSMIFHGTHDRVVPFESSRRFMKKALRKKNVCELVPFEGQEHSFFNLNVDFDLYGTTLKEADRFLTEQGFLSPVPPEEKHRESNSEEDLIEA